MPLTREIGMSESLWLEPTDLAPYTNPSILEDVLSKAIDINYFEDHPKLLQSIVAFDWTLSAIKN